MNHALKSFFVLLTTLFCYENALCSSGSIFMNDEEVAFLGPRAVICYTVPDDCSNISFTIENKKIKVGSSPTADLMAQASTIHGKISAQKDNLAGMIAGETLSISTTEGAHTHRAAYLSSGDDMLLSSGKTLTLEQTLATSGRHAIFTAPTLKTGAFFLTASGTVRMMAPEDTSGWLEALEFAPLPGDRPFHYMFQGELEFNPPATSSFIAVGAKTIAFHFKQ